MITKFRKIGECQVCYNNARRIPFIDETLRKTKPDYLASTKCEFCGENIFHIFKDTKQVNDAI